MSAPTGNEAVDAALAELEPLVVQAQLNRALRRAHARYEAVVAQGGLDAGRAFVGRLNLAIADRRHTDTVRHKERRTG
jgi:hypothetical protein